MQRGESNGIAMTKQTVNGKVRVLQSGREASSKNRERESEGESHQRASNCSKQQQQQTRGAYFLDLFWELITHTQAHHIPSHELWAL